MIRVYILLVCLFIGKLSWAQQIESFRNQSLVLTKQGDLNQVLKHKQNLYREINPSKVNTGILYDKIIPFSNIDQHSGAITSSLSSKQVFSQLYFELNQASIRKPSINTFEQLQSSFANEGDVVPIALLNYKYTKIKEDAFNKGLLDNRNGKVTENRLALESPYLTKRAFASASLKEWTYRGNKVTFRLDKGLYLSNENESLKGIKVNFDDLGGFQQVSFDEDITIHYSSAGIKRISVEVSTADHITLQSSFLFEVKSLYSPDHTDIELTSDIAYNHTLASGTAYVYKSPLNEQVKHPIIILEGFDTSNELFADELYALVNQQNLADNLLSKGYDLILVNFTDATTYIQANALLTVKLITYVNQYVKAGNNPSVIIGASMGGLVAKYALSYMEKHQLPHQAALFVSFDTPHQGANIPLGDQYWIDFFSSQNTTAAQKLSQINSIAAQQMLVYHQLSFPYPNLLRQKLVQELDSLAYPQHCRNIAISNGNAAGYGQPYNPGDPLVSWRYRNFWVDIDGNTWAVPQGETLTTITDCLLDKFGPSYASLQVSVSGTNSYDNAPGGTRATNLQIADTQVKQGDIKSANPNHCFIPTTSSLDINTEDLFHNIGQDTAILCKTPFQAIYYPGSTASDFNQEHVSITTESVNWIMQELEFLPNSPVGDIALRVNFQDTSPVPSGWMKDDGKAFSEQTYEGKSYSYGWKRRDNALPVNLSANEYLSRGNGVRRNAPCNKQQATFIYMQANDLENFNGVPVESYWELALENGFYQVSVSVGDSEIDHENVSESHSVNIEGINVISQFVPQGNTGAASRFKQATIGVEIKDGFLTLDAAGGTNTKINYIIIQPLPNAVPPTDALASGARKSWEEPLPKVGLTQLKVYPNPFEDKLMIDNISPGNTVITLFDILGTKYYQATYRVHTREQEVNFSAIPIKTGIYLLSIQAENGSRQWIRVLKK
jgi:hypothetical protein